MWPIWSNDNIGGTTKTIGEDNSRYLTFHTGVNFNIDCIVNTTIVTNKCGLESCTCMYMYLPDYRWRIRKYMDTQLPHMNHAVHRRLSMAAQRQSAQLLKQQTMSTNSSLNRPIKMRSDQRWKLALTCMENLPKMLPWVGRVGFSSYQTTVDKTVLEFNSALCSIVEDFALSQMPFYLAREGNIRMLAMWLL